MEFYSFRHLSHLCGIECLFALHSELIPIRICMAMTYEKEKFVPKRCAFSIFFIFIEWQSIMQLLIIFATGKYITLWIIRTIWSNFWQNPLEFRISMKPMNLFTNKSRSNFGLTAFLSWHDTKLNKSLLYISLWFQHVHTKCIALSWQIDAQPNMNVLEEWIGNYWKLLQMHQYFAF